jgi:patatin-like phospholipase/acyl hydrolase
MSGKKKLIKILSIDGGGIRGLIPALILQDIEKKLKRKKHLSECFDLMSGTSTGGIIVLLLNTPDANKAPKYQASDVVSLYQNLGSTVFNQSWWHYLSTFNGWLSEKYASGHLEMNLQKFYENCRLREALTNIIIPAYDISKDDNVFFKSDKAKQYLARDFYFKDIARATSAAPTYFKPAQIQDISCKETYTLVDGGLALNNPTLSACVHALKLFGRDNDFLIVSIGTGTNNPVAPGKLSFEGKDINCGGKLEWAPDIVSVMMKAANEVVDYQMEEIFKGDNGNKTYHRLQVSLDPKHTAFDNASPENMKALGDYAEELIHKKQADLKEIASLLDG